MKIQFVRIVLPLVLLAGVVLAADDESTDVVSISVKQIQADHEQLQDRKYVSTGQPDSETLVLIADAGFTTVIDMRTDGEDRGIDEANEISALGMTYISIPVAGADGVTFKKAQELDEALSDVDGPVLLHCGSGNRVGAIFALRASLNGASSEEALMIGKQAGLTRLEPVVQSRLAEK